MEGDMREISYLLIVRSRRFRFWLNLRDLCRLYSVHEGEQDFLLLVC